MGQPGAWLAASCQAMADIITEVLLSNGMRQTGEEINRFLMARAVMNREK